MRISHALKCRLLSGLVISSLFWAGCQALGLHNGLSASDQTTQQQPAAQATAVPPEGHTLFSERPETDGSGYENRLLTNMTQHTFSTVGRDFDPDLLADGSVMVFASTRNSEHPDIFLKRVDGYALTQLTSDPADDIQPRFSPSGDKVAFCSNRTGNWDIWVINLDGTELTQLTHDPADEVAPCFSPDGQRVAFSTWGRRSGQWEIWVLSLDRPGVRRFLCYGMFPDYSPDGKRIAFQRARQRGTRWFSIWSVELVGDEARHPTELAFTDSAACIAPRWTPDGEAIVYCAVQQSPEADESGNRCADVWLLDTRSGTHLKITDGAADAFNPTCSRTGRVYFVSARSGVENIWSLKTELGSYPVSHRNGGESGLSPAGDTAVESTGK